MGVALFFNASDKDEHLRLQTPELALDRRRVDGLRGAFGAHRPVVQQAETLQLENGQAVAQVRVGVRFGQAVQPQRQCADRQCMRFRRAPPVGHGFDLFA